jgi:hypothetical protein
LFVVLARLVDNSSSSFTARWKQRERVARADPLIRYARQQAIVIT